MRKDLPAAEPTTEDVTKFLDLLSAREFTFYHCLMECAKNKKLVDAYDQLRGTNLSLKGSPLELEVDKDTGRLESELANFVKFCYECIWIRLPTE